MSGRRAPLHGAALAALVSISVAAPALAVQPQVTVQVTPNRVEVGESFTVELRISGAQGTVGSPELHPPPSVAAVGQTMTRFSQGGFGTPMQTGVSVTWQLVAQQKGRIMIPGPTFLWNGDRTKTSALTVNVVAGTGRAPKPVTTNPFLMPGGGSLNFNWPFGNDTPDDDPTDRDSSELSLPSAPDSTVFLHAVADKKTAVVGEQVTLSFYIYYRESHQIQEFHEAPLADFRRFPLLKNPGTEAPVTARVGAARFEVKLWDRVAVFPLRVGALHTGSMRMKIAGRGLGGRDERASEDQIIDVIEPPLEGRPPGYVVGDVGRFHLAATVEPRVLDEGGEVAVTLKLEGSGNFPQSLRTPARTGVEWLDPEKKEEIAAQAGSVSGWRTFGYVVRVKERGHVNLGTVELPYWDPGTKRYGVAKAELGTVDARAVIPKANAAGITPPPDVEPVAVDAFAALPAPRTTLGPYRAPRAPLWGEGHALWLLLAAPPLLVGLSFGGSSASLRFRTRRAAGKASPAALAARALEEAAAAETRGDVKGVAAALERAIHLAIEGATGLKSRGVLLADLPRELAARDVDHTFAAEVTEALAACESIRFDPAGASAARDLTERARDVVDRLGRDAGAAAGAS